MRSTVNGRPFEIPDVWWDAGGMLGFTPCARAFSVAPQNADDTIVDVPISDVTPPERNSGVQPFNEERMISILSAFRSGTPLPPIEVNETSAPPYRYKVYDGYHRYYASAAAGFSNLAVIVRPLFDWEVSFVAELRH